MKQRVFISTLGCKVNQADSDELAEKYLLAGYELADKNGPADICIVNTCTVTAKADAQCRNEIRRLKKKHSSAKIIVTGCYANTAEDELKKMPEVDEIVDRFGVPASMRNPPMLPFSKGGRGGIWTQGRQHASTPARTRPQVKIQDGCNNFCAYCIVPYARGRSRSVPAENVIAKIKPLKNAGYKEVVLTGIHLGAYGLDLSPPTNLLNLLMQLTDDRRLTTDHCFRIRLSSIDPDEWTDELIDFAVNEKLICPHFHIPLQSGSDEILEKMGRRYTTGDYRKLIERLLNPPFLKGEEGGLFRLPSFAAIGADVIVGFPGETKEHFEQTRKFIKSLPLTYLHVFPYSRRKPTSSAKLEETVTNAEKQRRVTILRKISNEKWLEFYKGHIGKKLNVVIEHRRDKKTGRLKGVSENYIPVLLDGEDELMGKIVEYRLQNCSVKAMP